MKYQGHGYWREVKPKGLARKDRKHSWLFAVLCEWRTDRTDSESYTALLFRDADRTLFGLKEWIGPGPHQQVLREHATKVVVDKAFRVSLLSDDPDLPRAWKRY